MTDKPPGLVSREVVNSDEKTVTIKEIWDPRVPGCPMVVFDQTVWPWKTRDDVESVTHTFKQLKAGLALTVSERDAAEEVS